MRGRKMRTDAEMREHIQRHSMPEPNTGCWIWMRAVDPLGYGVARWGSMRGAHRMSFVAFKGAIPPGRVLVTHSCDTPCCVAPHHLSLGTDKTNSDDMHRRGRGVTGRKTGPNPRRKLTVEQAMEIRASAESVNVIARRFGVGHNPIVSIRSGRTYPEAASVPLGWSRKRKPRSAAPALRRNV